MYAKLNWINLSITRRALHRKSGCSVVVCNRSNVVLSWDSTRTMRIMMASALICFKLISNSHCLKWKSSFDTASFAPMRDIILRRHCTSSWVDQSEMNTVLMEKEGGAISAGVADGSKFTTIDSVCVTYCLTLVIYKTIDIRRTNLNGKSCMQQFSHQKILRD